MKQTMLAAIFRGPHEFEVTRAPHEEALPARFVHGVGVGPGQEAGIGVPEPVRRRPAVNTRRDEIGRVQVPKIMQPDQRGFVVAGYVRDSAPNSRALLTGRQQLVTFRGGCGQKGLTLAPPWTVDFRWAGHFWALRGRR